MCKESTGSLSVGVLPRRGNQLPGSCYTLSGWVFIFLCLFASLLCFCLCICIFCFDVLILGKHPVRLGFLSISLVSLGFYVYLFYCFVYFLVFLFSCPDLMKKKTRGTASSPCQVRFLPFDLYSFIPSICSIFRSSPGWDFPCILILLSS